MRGAMLFCPGVTSCSSKQSLKLYESPIDKQHKYEQNLKRIMRQCLVDVGLLIARPSDLFWWLYTLWITLLQYCGCWWPGDATDEVAICYCIKPFNLEHPDLNTRDIDFWENGLFSGSALHWRHNEHDGVSTHQPHDCLLNRLFGCRSNKTSKLCVTGLCEGSSPLTGEFPTRRASNAENVSIWWRHHVYHLLDMITNIPTQRLAVKPTQIYQKS